MDTILFLIFSHGILFYFGYERTKKNSESIKEYNNLIKFITKDMNPAQIDSFWEEYKGSK